jgi:hypothetical protein
VGGYGDFNNSFLGYPEVFPAALIVVTFNQTGSLKHLQMIDYRLWPYIQAFGHLVEVEWPERKELENPPSVLVAQYIQKLDGIHNHHLINFQLLTLS